MLTALILSHCAWARMTLNPPTQNFSTMTMNTSTTKAPVALGT